MKFKWLAVLLLMLGVAPGLAGCSTAAHDAAVTRKARPMPFTSPKGTQYQLLQTADKDDYKPALRKAQRGDTETDLGTFRRAAKLTPANAPLEVYKNLWVMMSSLHSEDEMLAESTPKTAAAAARTPYEQGNVQVKAFLYAAKREPDNSFRLLIGTYAQPDGTDYMSAVIPGLPADGAHVEQFRKVRQSLRNFFGARTPNAEGYLVILPAVPVIVTGSLLFAYEHGPHDIGTGPVRPSTCWELSPVTDLLFEPDK